MAAAETAAVEVQVLPPAPEIPAGGEAPQAPQESYAPQTPDMAGSQASEGAGQAGQDASGQPATAPASPYGQQYDFSQAEVPAGAADGGMAPVPSGPETPPESVPEMTAPAGAPDPNEWHAEPETMDMEQQPAWPPADHTYGMPPSTSYEAPTPAPEIGAGEVDQMPAKSAASLLASLQKPVPKLESEAGAPAAPSSSEAPAQPPATEAHPEPSLVSKATEGEHAPAEVEQKEVGAITRVRCAGCKAAIPIFSARRPLVVTCPQCGRMGMLK